MPGRAGPALRLLSLCILCVSCVWSRPLGVLSTQEEARLDGISQQPLGRRLEAKTVHREEMRALGKAFPPPCPMVPSPLPKILDVSSGPLHEALEALENELSTLFASPSVNATGAILTVFYGDQPLRTISYGVTEPGGGSIDENSVFGIGSVSKLFPVYSLFQLRDVGKVSLDTQVHNLNAGFHPHPFPTAATKRGASLADLASHMSGLGRYAPCDFGNCSISTDEALAQIAQWTLQFPPGGRVSYCNTGFSLLGRLLESVKGSTFEQYVEEDILAPLGMHDTFFAPPLSNNNLARPFIDGKPVPPPSLGWSVPAGGMYSSASDMRVFLQSILRWHAAAGSRPDQLLDGTTLREWLNRRVWDNPTPIPPNSAYFEGWGIPWQILSARYENLTHFDRFFMYTKDGSVPGYHTQVVLAPDLKMGVFASMTTAANNQGGSFYSDVVLESTFRIFPAIYAAAAATSKPPQPPSPGEYAGNFVITSQLGNATLYVREAQAAGEGLSFWVPILGRTAPAPLVWLDGDVFNMGRTADEACERRQGGNDDYNVRFVRDHAGRVSAAFIEGLTTQQWHRQ